MRADDASVDFELLTFADNREVRELWVVQIARGNGTEALQCLLGRRAHLVVVPLWWMGEGKGAVSNKTETFAKTFKRSNMT